MRDSPASVVKQLLPKLSENELREVVALANQLRAGKRFYHGGDVGQELLYCAVAEEMGRRCGSLPPSLPLIKQNNGGLYRRFEAAAEWLGTWTDSAFRNSIDRTQRRMFYALCVLLIAENLERCNIPLSFTSLINSIERVPGLINDAFPGYIQGGVLWLVVEALRAKQPEEG